MIVPRRDRQSMCPVICQPLTAHSVHIYSAVSQRLQIGGLIERLRVRIMHCRDEPWAGSLIHFTQLYERVAGQL